MQKEVYMNIILKYIAFIVVVIFILLLVVKINELQKVIEEKDNQIAIEIEKQEILQDELHEMRLTMEWYMKNN